MAYLNIATWGSCSADFDTNVKATVLILDTEITRDWQSVGSDPLAATEVYVRDDQLAAAHGFPRLAAAKALRPMSQFAAHHPGEAGWWR